MQGLTKEDIEKMKRMEFEDYIDFKLDDFDIPAAPDDSFFTEEETNVKSNKKTKNSGNGKNEKIKSVHKGHRQRVRDKFLKHGLDSFTEFEVLEFLLYYSIPYKDTNEIAHRLIDKFGSLNAVLEAEYYDLMEVNGISENSASLIVLYRELFKYVRTSKYAQKYLPTSSAVGQFCCDYFYNHVEESFILISMDSNRTVQCIDVISKGTENETAFYPRKIMKTIVKNRASSVIFAHNHPGENPEPSSYDLMLTNKFNIILKAIGIRLADHIICSGDRFVSISDKGLI